MREIAVGGDDRRVEFSADRRDQCVAPAEKRASRADFVRDLAGEFRRLLTSLVDLAPRQGRSRLGNVAVRVVPRSRENFGVRRGREDEPLSSWSSRYSAVASTPSR
jgi:hypothetical protein